MAVTFLHVHFISPYFTLNKMARRYQIWGFNMTRWSPSPWPLPVWCTAGLASSCMPPLAAQLFGHVKKRQLLGDEDIRESWWIANYANYSWSCDMDLFSILCFVFSFVASCCRIEDQRGLLGEFPSRWSASGRLLPFRAAFRVVSRRNERSSGCFLRGRA